MTDYDFPERLKTLNCHIFQNNLYIFYSNFLKACIYDISDKTWANVSFDYEGCLKSNWLTNPAVWAGKHFKILDLDDKELFIIDEDSLLLSKLDNITNDWRETGARTWLTGLSGCTVFCGKNIPTATGITLIIQKPWRNIYTFILCVNKVPSLKDLCMMQIYKTHKKVFKSLSEKEICENTICNSFPLFLLRQYFGPEYTRNGTELYAISFTDRNSKFFRFWSKKLKLFQDKLAASWMPGL